MLWNEKNLKLFWKIVSSDLKLANFRLKLFRLICIQVWIRHSSPAHYIFFYSAVEWKMESFGVDLYDMRYEHLIIMTNNKQNCHYQCHHKSQKWNEIEFKFEWSNHMFAMPGLGACDDNNNSKVCAQIMFIEWNSKFFRISDTKQLTFHFWTTLMTYDQSLVYLAPV